MRDFIEFRRMLTPVVIKVVFWIGVIICVGAGLVLFLSGIAQGNAEAIPGGIVLMIFGPIFLRILAEGVILFFTMNETLTDIKNALEKPAGSQGNPPEL
jgi:hypothetical protein